MVDRHTIPIVWTDFAKAQLKEIYQYYKLEISITVAKNIRSGIFSATRQLKKFPESGTIEYNLEEHDLEFRYLVQGNYKIVYWYEDNLVYISDIFDCRKDPIEMKTRAGIKKK